MTTETAVDLAQPLFPVQRYGVKLLLDSERSLSECTEFSVAQHFTWNTGSESVDMTTLVTVQQPTLGHFNLRIDFDGNGSEVFRLAYGERIIDWTVDLLEASGWEIVVSTNSAQKARVSWDEGFVFFVKRANTQR
jgi:hypothetical protein